MRIIVDVMSGDNAPLELIKGVCASSAENADVEYTLVGDTEIINALSKENALDISRFAVIHASDVIKMEDDPITAVRSRPEASMIKGLRALANGEGDAFVSAGNTGALFTGASLIVKRAAGVRRTAIGALLPMDPPVLLLDAGANITVDASYLEQFAVMGTAYMKSIHGLESPRVGLLNNGSEDCKGTAIQIEAYKLLSQCKGINFVGNVEGNMVMGDKCDVLVTDGYTGNILLKSIEGMGKMMLLTMKELFYTNTKTKMAALLLKSELGGIKKKFDAGEYGGAPILGIAKPVIKAHGSSVEKSFKNAIKQAIFCARTGMTDDMSAALKELAESKKKADEEQDSPNGN